MKRSEARRRGLKKYAPDQPCVHGHRLRYTSTGGCVACQQAANEKTQAQTPYHERVTGGGVWGTEIDEFLNAYE